MDKDQFVDKLKYGDTVEVTGYDFFFNGNKVLAEEVSRLIESFLQDPQYVNEFGARKGKIKVITQKKRFTVTAMIEPRRLTHAETVQQLMENRALCEAIVRQMNANKDVYPRNIRRKLATLAYDGSENYLRLPDNDAEKFVQKMTNAIEKIS